MKNLILALVVLFLATTASAQLDPDTDMMGIYFDSAATSVCEDLPLFVPSSLYVCLTNASSSSGISGFEFMVTISPPPAIPPTYTLPSGSINVVTPPNFICGLAAPIPWSPSIVMLTIGIIPLDPLPIYFTLGPSVPSDFGPLVGYAVGNDPGILKSCGYSVSGAGICAIANLGPSCGVVASEELTWGNVKSMFR